MRLSVKRLALAGVAVLALAAPFAVPAQESPAPPYSVTQADEAATLLADRITLTGSNRLVAEGAVEVYWHEHRLSARRLSYDQSTDTLTIEGPIRLVEPGMTGSVLLADSAELSRDLQNGILIGARMVIARELQLAANSIERRGGTVTVLNQVVASSCQICASNPTPLWEIRARRISHNATTHVLHFDDAEFRALGVPLMWLPNLRLPDPTVKRMTGLLRPSLRTTTSLGVGLKWPYFITLGPSADLTVTPYFATAHTRTLGLRYRRALSFGSYSVEGAVSRDSILPNKTRGYFQGEGRFALPGDFTLGAQLRFTTDPSYLLNYDITEDDRLWSGITLERVRRDELIWAKIGNTHTIRSGESNASEPMLSGRVNWIKTFQPNALGGEVTIDTSLTAHRRASDMVTDGPDIDTASDGRDMIRASLVADWRRNWVLGPGILAALKGEVALDAAAVRQDAAYQGNSLRALPSLGVELRWPWVATSGRAAQVIEPVVQLIWSGDDLKALPNEDSLLTEFDEGNLFAFSRYPGGDARERGLRANLGLSWTRHDASGWSLGLTAGRVLRARDLGEFSAGSGLGNKSSDWLLATHLTTAGGLTLSNRALFDDAFAFSRDELRLSYLAGPTKIAAGYLWMQANPSEYRPANTNELLLETAWTWRPGWSSTFSTRYDFTSERAAKAAFGLQYANECVSVDLSLSRRFTSSSSVEPETDFGLSIQLAGFGAGTTTGRAERVCRR